MNDTALNSQALGGKQEKPYLLAGWLAITMAVLFPLGFLIGIIQQVITAKIAHHFAPTFGIGDLIFLANTLISVYVLLKFRKLLNETYDFKAINTLITLSILWIVLFEVESIGIKLMMISMWPLKDLTVALIQIPFMVFNLLAIGVVDLLMGLKLLKHKESLGGLFVPFAYITLIAAICELSLLLSPIALILVPVSSVIMGMIFLREKEDVEFV